MKSTRRPRKPVAKAPLRPAAKVARTSASRPAAGRMTCAEAMRALEAAGSEQTRKTYQRFGIQPPMFGVSFAALKTLVKKIGVDHALAQELFETGNHDARMLALKVADPAQVTPAQLDRFARGVRGRGVGGYAAMLAAESPHGPSRARAWLAAKDEVLRCAGWTLAGCLASVDTTTPDAWFGGLVDEIEKTIHAAPNAERDVMNMTLIAIGGRNPALRKAATAAAKRIGTVVIDQGDTSCKTREAIPYIEKAWAHARAKKFASPAAQERDREPMRTRC